MKTTDKEVAIVYATTNYKQFKSIKGNRDVLPSRVARIAESIDRIGVRMVPIVVNEKMEVIDGQGRLEAIRESGKPVYYVIDKNAGVDECRWLNIGCKNWSLYDFVKSYAELGNEDYKCLRGLFDEYQSRISVNTIISVSGGNHARYPLNKLKNGEFKMGVTVGEAAKRLEYLVGFVPKIEATGGQMCEIFSAIMFAYDTPGIDRDRLFERFCQIDVDKEGGLRGSVIGNLRLLEDIYNYHLCASSRIYLVHEWQTLGARKPCAK